MFGAIREGEFQINQDFINFLSVYTVKPCVMKLILHRDAGTKEVRQIEKKLYEKKSQRGFNAKKYNGVLISVTEDALTIQKKLRDEWERNLS